ncbi:hypothetical protein Taro_049079 [Colocasia esculenta]|uniref:Uncharacterized protein n=1 Tax=Colocasia esculenta TaxID=4460 RepID=A0A843X9W8_COLES|nr:hypothetical protein [Colocasia esculenta]
MIVPMCFKLRLDRCIAGNFGEVLRIHDSTLAWTQTAEALVCVDVDIAKPLPDRIWIGHGDGEDWAMPRMLVRRSRGTWSRRLASSSAVPANLNDKEKEWRLVKRKGLPAKDNVQMQSKSTVLVSNVFERLANVVGVLDDPSKGPSTECLHSNNLQVMEVNHVQINSQKESSAPDNIHVEQPVVPDASLNVHGTVHVQPPLTEALPDQVPEVNPACLPVVMPEVPPSTSSPKTSDFPNDMSPVVSPVIANLPKVVHASVSPALQANILRESQGKLLNHEGNKIMVASSLDPGVGIPALSWNIRGLSNMASKRSLKRLIKCKLKATKDMLKSWNKNVFGRVEDEVRLAESLVKVRQISFDEDPSAENRASLNAANASLRRAIMRQEFFWAQKARAPPSLARRLSSITGFHQQVGAFRYLGVPIRLGRTKVADYKFLMDKCSPSTPQGYISLYASMLVIWEIWRGHCLLRFEGKRGSVHSIVHNIRFMVSASLDSVTFKHPLPDRGLVDLSSFGFSLIVKARLFKIVRWIPPDSGLVLNVDGASKGNPGLCEGGGDPPLSDLTFSMAPNGKRAVPRRHPILPEVSDGSRATAEH